MYLKVGRNLPCIDSVEEKPAEFDKSAEDREFDDIAKFPVGKTCPISRDGSAPSDNQFKAQIVYELPPSTTVSSESSYETLHTVRKPAIFL